MCVSAFIFARVERQKKTRFCSKKKQRPDTRRAQAKSPVLVIIRSRRSRRSFERTQWSKAIGKVSVASVELSVASAGFVATDRLSGPTRESSRALAVAKHNSVRSLPLECMNPAQVAVWLRSQQFAPSVDADSLSALLLERKICGARLARMSNTDLREEVGVKQLGWRKALIRVVEARHELCARSSSSSRKVERAVVVVDPMELSVPMAASSFALRRESFRLRPLATDDDALASEGAKIRPAAAVPVDVDDARSAFVADAPPQPYAESTDKQASPISPVSSAAIRPWRSWSPPRGSALRRPATSLISPRSESGDYQPKPSKRRLFY